MKRMHTKEHILKANQTVNLQQIYAEESHDNLVYSIREEILQKTMTEIEAITLKERLTEFVVDVALEALMKMISFEFYHHNAGADPLSEAWARDEPIPPSPPDSWAVGRVPFHPKREAVKETTVESKTESVANVCECDLGVKCECYLSPEERIRDQIAMLNEDEEENSEQLLEQGGDASRADSSADDVLSPTEETKNSLSATSDGIKEKLSFVETKSLSTKSEFMLKEDYYKMSAVKKRVSLPKIDVSRPVKAVPISKMVELPPIRIDAKFESKPEEVNKKKKKK